MYNRQFIFLTPSSTKYGQVKGEAILYTMSHIVTFSNAATTSLVLLILYL